MDFIDDVTFWVYGGRGGDGCVSFRREKYVPKGGPDGGDGGHGGNVILYVKGNCATFSDMRHRKSYKAEHGQHGRGKKQHGKNGANVHITVPAGTIVSQVEDGIVLRDLTAIGSELCIAKGGRGGRGNPWFATSSSQTPEKATPGKEGEERHIRLELKLLADVGLVGLPNAGKSTLLSRISSARPKIANYPFTTLVPNLGIVTRDLFDRFVVADIPGLIEGAHQGRGLGDRFLRHIERTRVLVFLIEALCDTVNETYQVLLKELGEFQSSLLDKPHIVALTKTDTIDDDTRSRLPDTIDGIQCYPVSAVSGQGLDVLLAAVDDLLSEVPD